jgi:hypothetical protein
MKDTIKIQLIQVVKKELSAYNKFPPKMRGKIHNENFLSKPSLGSIPVSELNTKTKIAELVWREGGPGTWLVCGTRPNKHTVTGFSPGAIVRLTIEDHPFKEQEFQITDWRPMRLKRYKKILGWKDESIY